MKKIIIILISVLMLTSCSKKEEVEPVVIEEPVQIDYVDGVALIDNLLIEYDSLNRNDEIKIVDEDDELYYFYSDGLVLGIKKEFVRTENDEPFREFVGYTRSGAAFYKDYNCEEKIDSFTLNQNVKVIDQIGDVYLVEYNGIQGFSYVTKISDKKIIIPKPVEAPIVEPQYSGSDSGGGSDAPSPAPSTDPTPSYGDGGDISLEMAYHQSETKVVLLDFAKTTKGKVLLNDTKVYIARLNRNDEVKIVDEEHILFLDDIVCKVDKDFIRRSDEHFTGYDGYAYGGAKLYSDYECNDVILTFKTNDNVRVIDDIKGLLVVGTEDRVIGYMLSEKVSKEEIYIAPTKQEPVEQVPDYSDNTPSDSGGSSNPAPAPEPEPEPTPDWTEPVL